MKAFWYNVNSSLYKSWPSGFRRGHSRENHITCVYIEKKILFRTNQTWYKSSLGKKKRKGEVLFQVEIITEM
jgi:hypothetical protein